MSRFAPVPSAAIEDETLSAMDLAVLMALAYHTDSAGWCWPSQPVIAKRARVHPKTVSPSLKALKARGYVEIHRPENGDLSKTSYRVIFDTARAPAQSDTQDTALTVQDGKPPLSVEDGKLPVQTRKLSAVDGKASRPGRNKQEPSNQLIELKNPPPDENADLFEEIWSVWSRKLKSEGHAGRGEGKAKTARIFSAKAKTTDPALIRSAAIAWAKRSSGFLEGLSVFLNKERYDTGDNVVSLNSRPPVAPDWSQLVLGWQVSGAWSPEYGPAPNEPGYRGALEPLKAALAAAPVGHPVIAGLRANLQAERLLV